MLVWILPILAVVVGGFIFWRYLRDLRAPDGESDKGFGDDTAMMAQGSAQKPPPAPDEDDYISRIEKEVREE